MIPDTTQAALASDLDGTMSVELDPKDTVHSIAAVRLLGQIQRTQHVDQWSHCHQTKDIEVVL